jgi:hypothetical protein
MSAEEIQIPMLQVGDLYTKRQRRDAARLKAYNEILEQIYNRVRVTSQLPTHPAYLLYTIPPFIFGLPKIDLEDCVVYLVYQLRSAGFEVRYTYPNLIYISWKHHEKKYLLEESPILQAMLATQKAAAPSTLATAAAASAAGAGKGPAAKGALKPARKVTFSGEPSAANPRGRQQPFEPPASDRPKREVGDYTPPRGFFAFDTRPSLGDSRGAGGGGGSSTPSDTTKKFKSLFDF